MYEYEYVTGFFWQNTGHEHREDGEQGQSPSKRIMHLGDQGCLWSWWVQILFIYGKGRSRSLQLMSEREWNSDSTSGGILAGIMQGAGAPTHHIKIHVYQHTSGTNWICHTYIWHTAAMSRKRLMSSPSNQHKIILWTIFIHIPHNHCKHSSNTGNA